MYENEDIVNILSKVIKLEWGEGPKNSWIFINIFQSIIINHNPSLILNYLQTAAAYNLEIHSIHVQF